MVAVFEPQGVLATCTTKARDLRLQRGSAEWSEHDDAIRALDAECGGLLEDALDRAVSHEDACSPYRPALRELPDPGVMVGLTDASLLAVRARFIAARGEPARAMWLVLDTVRLFQDFARGRAPLVPVMLGVAAYRRPLESAHAVIGTSTLSAHELDELIAATNTLLATEPTFADIIGGEQAWFELRFGLRPYDEISGSMGATISDDTREDAVLWLAVTAALAKNTSIDCPPTASLATCYHSFAQRASAARSTDDDARERYLALRFAPRTVRRNKLIDTLVEASDARWIYSTYVAKRALAITRLIALRLHLEIARTGKCPTAAELDSTPFATLRRPAILGDSVIVTRQASALDVAPPTWAQEEPARHITIPCP